MDGYKTNFKEEKLTHRTVAIRSAVCSGAPHLQCGEEARFHSCMDEWNRPTPVCRRLSINQAVQGKLIPTSLVLVMGVKARSQNAPTKTQEAKV